MSELLRPNQQTRRPELTGLSFIRFVAALIIVAYHFFSHTFIGSFAEWGASQLTLFFCLSGFVLSYQHTNREEQLSLVPFWLKRFTRLYPPYLFSIALQCVLLQFTSDIQEKEGTSSYFYSYSYDYYAQFYGDGTIELKQLVIMLFSLQTWIAPAFYNPINTPAWAIGSFLFLYLIFPTMIKCLQGCSYRKRCVFFVVAWALSAVQALEDLGYRFTMLAPINHIFFAAHTPSFFMGVLVGGAFVQSSERIRQRYSWFGIVGLIAVLLPCLLVNHGSLPPFWRIWSHKGMFAPPMLMLIWTAATPASLTSKFLSLPPFIYLGKISLGVYILQTSIYTLCERILCPYLRKVPLPCEVVFVVCLVLASIAVYHAVEQPCALLYPSLKRCTERCMLSVFGQQPPLGYAPPPGSSLTGGCSVATICQVLLYYALFALILVVYLFWGFVGFEWMFLFDVTTNPVVDSACTILKSFAFLSLPALAFSTIGHLRWPAPLKRKTASFEAMVQSGHFEGCVMRFRYVTRGKYPQLITENVIEAARVLRHVCQGLPERYWRLEVCTDNAMGLSSRCHDVDVNEIVVPDDYVALDNSGQETKYKARALHYAIRHGGAGDRDWIIHLDEETRFDERTVRTILQHCSRENFRVESGTKEFGNIGQGVILYGTGRVGPIQNWVTTLADSIRVADDFGKFRFQYEWHEPWIGMHGSFVVVSQAVEEAVGFAHGLAGSITEDAHFALLARGKYGVKFSWVDSFMYEQSPFGLKDFIMQRRRWFGGLWLVCRDIRIPLKQRVWLIFMMFSWGFSFMVGVSSFLALLVQTSSGRLVQLGLAAVAGLSCWGYVLGFVLTFRAQDGVVRYILLLIMQLLLQPLFAVLEITGVCYAIIKPPIEGFFIVQKENAQQQQRRLARENVKDELVGVSDYTQPLLDSCVITDDLLNSFEASMSIN